MSLDLMTRLAYDWGVRCFGRDHMMDQPTRALRCMEEAVELAQALKVPRELAHQLVHSVYERPEGHPVQEAGGVLLTASVLCHAVGLPPERVYEMELSRCLSMSPEHFAKRNEEKMRVDLTSQKSAL